jgi:hypothetical protein
LGRAGRLGVTSPPVAPRGEPSARRATLGASTTPQPDVRPFPPTHARDSSASPPSKPPSGGSHLPPSPPLPQPPAKGKPYWSIRYSGVLAPASLWTRGLAPMAPSETPAEGQRPRAPEGAPSHRPWAELLARTFAVDVPRVGKRPRWPP